MLFNCCIVSALKHLFNGRVLPALHLFVGHKNNLIQLCFVFMSQVHMTLGRFAGARSQVFSSHSAQIPGGYYRQQPKSAMEQSPLMAAQICHGAVTFDGSPNLPWSGTLEKSAMEQTALSSPWSGHLGAIRHGAGCLETAMEQATLEQSAMEQDALRPPWNRPPWSRLP
jgi:hypothetical protein